MEHTYFVGQTSWCIKIRMNADILEFKSDHKYMNLVYVAEGVWLDYIESSTNSKIKIHTEYIPYLKRGLQMVMGQIQSHSIYQETVILIKEIEFGYCDFQEEGLIAVMIGWAAKAFEFDCPPIGVIYDKTNNRYVFNF